MPLQTNRTAVLFALTLLLAPAGLAQQRTAPPADAVDPKANDVLKRMSAFLTEADAFSFESHDLADETLPTGQKIQIACTRTFTLQRPNKLKAVFEGDTENEKYWYDGKTVSAFDPVENCYGRAEVPDTIEGMFAHVSETFGVTVPLADLLISDPHGAVVDRIRSGQYVGLHNVFDVKCHHLAFRSERVDWQIWIEDGDRPVPRKLVITYKEMPGHPQFIAFLNEWNFDPQFADGAFTFVPPQGAREIDLVSEAQRGSQPGNNNPR